MTKNHKGKKYDLEERTFNFSKSIVGFCLNLPKNTINNTLINQIIRSATSIGANYIEANESLSRKDFKYRLKISRKESKETIYWLKLINVANKSVNSEIIQLIEEAIELKKILSSIIEKADGVLVL